MLFEAALLESGFESEDPKVRATPGLLQVMMEVVQGANKVYVNRQTAAVQQQQQQCLTAPGALLARCALLAQGQ
jgi:hypothetical protein